MIAQMIGKKNILVKKDIKENMCMGMNAMKNALNGHMKKILYAKIVIYRNFFKKYVK